MSKRFTRAEAEALALILEEQYEFDTMISDIIPDENMLFEAHSFVGIHLNGRCIATFDSFSRWQDFKTVAYTIVSSDAYAILQKHLEEDHIEDRFLSKERVEWENSKQPDSPK